IDAPGAGSRRRSGPSRGLGPSRSMHRSRCSCPRPQPRRSPRREFSPLLCPSRGHRPPRSPHVLRSSTSLAPVMSFLLRYASGASSEARRGHGAAPPALGAARTLCDEGHVMPRNLLPSDVTHMDRMDAVRGTAILLLLVWHASAVPTMYDVAMPEAVRSANAFFLPFRMPTLMLLSGMLLARSLRKPLPRYLAGKFSMVLWPYVAWVVIAELTFLDQP